MPATLSLPTLPSSHSPLPTPHSPYSSLKRGRPPSFKRPPTSPELFTSSTHRLASNRIIWEGCNILSRGRQLEWTVAPDGGLSYESTVARGKGYISFLVAQDQQQLTAENAIALVQQFDVRAACIHLIYAAYATVLDRPWEQSFVISDRQLERYLGLDKNKKLTKPQKLQLLLDLAKQPCSLMVYVSWPECGKVKSFNVSRTALWEITEPLLHFQVDADGQQQLAGFTLKVRAGNWAEYFLNSDRCQDATGYYEYSIVSQSLLQSIMRLWYSHEGAARLMLWLLFKTRVSSDPVRSSTLLKIAFGEDKVEAARSDSFARKRLVQQWKNTLKMLHDCDWKLTFDSDTYPPQYLPDLPTIAPFDAIPDDPDEAAAFWAKDAQKAEGQRLTDATRKPYGGFERLLQAHLLIQPPAAIAIKLEEIRQQRRSRSASEPHRADQRHAAKDYANTDYANTVERKAIAKRKLDPPTSIQSGEQLKAWRIAKGMTQGMLATQIGKSTSWVKLVETGRRNITAGDRHKIVNLFAHG